MAPTMRATKERPYRNTRRVVPMPMPGPCSPDGDLREKMKAITAPMTTNGTIPTKNTPNRMARVSMSQPSDSAGLLSGSVSVGRGVAVGGRYGQPWKG